MALAAVDQRRRARWRRCPAPSSSGCGTGSPTAGRPGSARRPAAGSGPSARAAPARAAAPTTAAPGCRGATASRRPASSVPSSTTLPRYMTAIAVGEVPHDRQVVGDEQVGHAELVLQVLEQVDHLRLHRHVERRHRLVADDDLRLQGQRPGDADALALAAGELVRVAVDVVGVEADPLQQLLGALQPALAGRDVGVHRPALGHDVADGHARVQRAVRVLEDDLDLAAVPLERPAAHLGDVLALVEDRAAGRLLQGDQQLRHRRLAAAGLADQADRLAAAQRRGRRRRRRGRGRPSS